VRETDLQRRIQRLEDKESIRELAIRYGNFVDQRDPVALRSIFADNFRFYFKNGGLELSGPDEAVRFFTEQLNEVSRRSLHVHHGHVVDLDLDDPDFATGTQFGHSEGVAQDPEVGVRLAAVRYEDSYRRIEKRWLFEERCVSFFYQVEASNYLRDVASDTPVHGASNLPADF